jgi:D-alanyl-D-alanine carboxypeptidase/D-alanyl-D-alanine-endopeptidase (penicillin-binding protein 4)
LNWRENQYRLILSPGNMVGDPVTLVALLHPPPSLNIVNQAITGPPNTGDRTNLYLALDGTHAYLRGSLGIDSGANFSIGGAIPNSGLYVTDELRQAMLWPSDTPISIMLKSTEPINTVTDRTTLDIHSSPLLSDILYWFEYASINLYGELIVKTIANIANSTYDTILPTYCQNEHGIEQTAVATIDGSGLSPENRVTTWALARVLFDVQRESWFPIYQRALPIINGICMKYGYIKNVISYAGYVNRYVFSIITNNFNGNTDTMRQKIWNLLDTLK